MKKNKGSSLFIIGLVLTILGLTIFDNNQTLQYIALSLGVIIGIYSVFKFDMPRKKEIKK